MELRTLKSYQAIPFVKVQDPEIIPGNILSRTYRILIEYHTIYFLKIADPEVIPGNTRSKDTGS